MARLGVALVIGRLAPGAPLYFHITADSAGLIEPEDVRSFSARCSADLGDDALVATVAAHDLGEVLPGGTHLMVPVDTIRRMASGQVGPEWPIDLAKMIDYAANKGWTSEDGTHVRAHLERG
jgi:hypothetical protein